MSALHDDGQNVVLSLLISANYDHSNCSFDSVVTDFPILKVEWKTLLANLARFHYLSFLVNYFFCVSKCMSFPGCLLIYMFCNASPNPVWGHWSLTTRILNVFFWCILCPSFCLWKIHLNVFVKHKGRWFVCLGFYILISVCSL